MSSEWSLVTLGDILTLQRGIDLPIQSRKHGTVPIIASTGITGYHNFAPVKAPGVVIGRSGSIGGGQYIEQDFHPLNTTLWVKDFKGNHPRFCYYLLRSIDFSGLNVGSGVPTLNRNHLHPIPMLCPPIKAQKEIATTLGVLDDRITLLRETNATLEAIAQALFKSWFVDFDPVHAKAQGRQPEGMDEQTAALFSDRFVESELGMVPAGWKISNLDNVSEVGIGKTPPRKEAHWFTENSSDVRWVSIRDMGNCGAFISTTSEYLTDTAIERLNVRKVPNNTVLLSFKMTIGRVAISDGNMTTNEAIAHFKLTDNSPISSEFIYLHLKQFNYSTLSSTSSIADAVNSKTVKSIPIIVPSADILSEFQSVIGNVFEQIKTIQHQTETLTDLRDTLLPRLISGQLRLPDVEAQ
jgi:type I restriction enzyme S subunit